MHAHTRTHTHRHTHTHARTHAHTRRRVLELVEVAHRGGLTAPWDAIPALVALSTDPAPDTAAKALSVLKQVRPPPPCVPPVRGSWSRAVPAMRVRCARGAVH